MAEIKAINVNGTPYDINLKDGKTLSINGLTVSGTASLTGTTTINSLTLGGDLNGNNKSISGINSISCATISATTANLSVINSAVPTETSILSATSSSPMFFVYKDGLYVKVGSGSSSAYKLVSEVEIK